MAAALAAIPLTSGLGEAASMRAISVLATAALASDGILLMRRARAIPELRRRGAVLPAAVLAAAEEG